MSLTQKERILNSLKAAGGLGVRSDVYIRDFMPRAAARIQELRDEGWDISSERDGKFVVWKLNNVGSNGRGSAHPRTDGLGEMANLSEKTQAVASGAVDSVVPSPEARARNHYDPFEEWAA